jgi:hypothetical protein
MKSRRLEIYYDVLTDVVEINIYIVFRCLAQCVNYAVASYEHWLLLAYI